MQAVIMAGGKGTRLGKITQDLPKPLVKIAGKPILEHTLCALPKAVDEAIFVVSYLGDKIRNYLGDKFDDRFGDIKITYVEQKELLGTADALWTAKEKLKNQRFLVINGDDLYDQKDIESLLKYDLAIGVLKVYKENNYGSRFFSSCVKCNDDATFKNFYSPAEEDITKGVLIVASPYLLDYRIFQYQPLKASNGEYSLPFTICSLAKDHPLKVVEMKRWFPIGYPEDIPAAEKFISFAEKTPAVRKGMKDVFFTKPSFKN